MSLADRPTKFHHKTGLAFLAYLEGHQDHFTMVTVAHSARPVPHLVKLFRLADAAWSANRTGPGSGSDKPLSATASVSR